MEGILNGELEITRREVYFKAILNHPLFKKEGDNRFLDKDSKPGPIE
jgi:hypothetical protein